MLKQFFKSYFRSPTRPIMAVVTAAALVLSSVNIVFAVASANAPVVAAVPLPALPASTQFDLTGFLQAATLDQACLNAGGANLDAQGFPQAAHCGGTLTLNGHTVVVPAETIAILPASALTWEELFAQAPAPYAPTQTGMAMSDVPAPLTTYEFNVIGNRVGDTYIAGLIHISQQDLNTGAGYINFMNYVTGEMRVGGVLGNPNTGARVRINDPANPTSASGGRYGRAMSPDGRFMVDQDNPTIASATGFPMCFPRVAPSGIDGVETDPLCPQANRPVDPLTGTYAMSIDMNDPANIPLGGAKDPRLQAPFEVGDYVTYAGTMIADNAGTYISAHTITNNVAIYTAPGTSPAYITIEVGLIGTGGLTVLGAGEAAIRTRFEGMTTDPSRNIHLYGVDVNPLTGATSDRDWGTIGVDPGPAGGAGAVRGRWRFRPPCLTFGSIPSKPDKQCVFGPDNGFLPPTREVRAVIEGLQSQNPANPAAITTANGIFFGQYHAPIGEYIFPENVPGTPIVENNFNAIPFLAQGGYTSFTGILVGQLNPWPSNIIPAPACTAPTANAGGPYTVGFGSTIAVTGTATGNSPTYQWTASAGSFSSGATTLTPVYSAAGVPAGPVTLTLTVTNACGAATSNATVTVNAALVPTVDAVVDQTVTSGDSSTFAVTGSDPNNPAATPLTFSVANDPTNTVNLTGLTAAQNGSTGANINYTAPSGVESPTLAKLIVTATNTAGLAASTAVNVTINPAVVACTVPTVSAGGPYSVGFGSTVALTGTSTGTSPITYAWTASAGSFDDATLLSPTYSAAGVPAGTIVNLTLTATNCATPPDVVATTTVTVASAQAPTVNDVAPISVFSSANGSFTVSGSDPNVPALLPVTYTVTQNGAPALLNLLVTPVNATSATVTFTAPTLPIGQVVNSVITLTITGTNAAGASSSVTTTVNVKPLPDLVNITNAEYRTSKQRLIITATTSVNSPNVILKLQPYVTITGATFDPATLGNTFSNVNGVLTLTLVGAPEPALPPATPLIVKSNLNGTSAPHGLDRIRQ